MMPQSNEYSCSIANARVYTLKGRAQNYGRWWAEVTIREWAGGGSVTIQSESGTYANFWTSVGEQCLRAFLCDLRFDYFMEKTRGWTFKEFDAENTLKELKERVLEGRRDGWLEHNDAREIWDDLPSDCLPYTSLSEMLADVDVSRIVDLLYDGDYCSAPNHERPKQECLNFWNVIWPCICEVWRKEFQEEKGEA